MSLDYKFYLNGQHGHYNMYIQCLIVDDDFNIHIHDLQNSYHKFLPIFASYFRWTNFHYKNDMEEY